MTAGSTGRGVAIGIDVGGSKTDAVLVDADCAELSTASAGGANLRTVGRQVAEANLTSVISPLLAGHKVRAICVGAAGAGRDADRDAMREVVKWATPPRMLVIVMHDGEIALRGVTDARPAMVVIAGTGSLAYGERADGTSVRAGGYGPVIGDPGSGYAIGLAAVQLAARALDGIEQMGTLAGNVARELGATAARDLAEVIDSAQPDAFAIARLATLVAAASDDGDAAAQQIIAENGRLLGSMAVRVAREIRNGSSPLPVALSGGAYAAVPALADAVAMAVAGSGPCKITRPSKSPAAGAAAIALERLRSTGAI